MAGNNDNLTIAFLWRKDDIKSSVVHSGDRTGTRAVFDLSSTDMESAGPALLRADARPDLVDLKISPASLMAPTLEEFLEETGVNRVWVELHPSALEKEPWAYLDRIVGLSANFQCFPIVGSIELISTIIREYPEIRAIALKGCEASGLVSSETTLILYNTVRNLIRDAGSGPDLLIWGGIATPEAAAAFLSTGSKGIVFESLHWLTDLVAVPDKLREKIAKLRPDHTDLVGLNFQAPCRVFNKGNSAAVKDLKDFAGSLCAQEITSEQERAFARRIEREAVSPLESGFGREELIPLGVEATFASSFVRRFGDSTEEAIDRFVRRIEDLCAGAGATAAAFKQSTAAAEMGTRYPFIQGAMSWITDVPEFAARVADAGALPTIALGLMAPETLNEKLGGISDFMGDRPYAVNVVTLAENPFRDAQLAWIKETKPAFAVIAAGEPSHARDLMEQGIGVIYIAPNEELLRLAFEAGIRFVVCEGNEAGGHVGENTTLTLAQTVLDLRDREPDLFTDRRIILAGGIHDRETAFMAAMLGADAVQMGTAYLATREIVETNALAALYQRMVLESDPEGTVVTGEGTGLRVRSLKTPRMEAICNLEKDFAAGSEDEATFRTKIESLSAGSLLIAARGVAEPGGKPLDEDDCIGQGQYMSGACSGALKDVRTLEDLHRELTEGELEHGLSVEVRIRDAGDPGPAEKEIAYGTASVRVPGPARQPVGRSGPERLAVTGMAVVNSLGNSPEEVWNAGLAMKSGIVEVPPSRWDHSIFYHPRPRMPEKTYCKVGAFQHIDVSRKDLGIPPQDFRTMTDATRITMWLADKAVQESGILDSDIPRERIAVLISQNSGEAAATLEDVIIRGLSHSIVSAVGRVIPLTEETAKAVDEQVKAGRMAVDDTTLLGRLNCSAGGFICNKYGFMGPSYSVSAACATALVALFSALQMIRNGLIDAAVVGGAEETLTPLHFLEFSALGALAGLAGVERPPDEVSRPFDKDRDGMVLGEGGGMIVIERESVAAARGASPHAYITSMGASNNHLGMVESSRITQKIAMGSSFKDMPYGPDEVDLVECHATSTVQGDVEEVLALKELFGSNGQTVLTSYKSQIGHTLGASGVNSLIRGIMATKSGVFPPTKNCETIDPEMALDGTGLRISTDPSEWAPRGGRPRRLQVNAFGFGGSNYVVHVEQAMEREGTVMVSPGNTAGAGEADKGLPEGVHLYRTRIGGSPYRMAVISDTEEEAVAAVKRAEPAGDSGPVGAKRIRTLARDGILVGSQDKAAPPLAFVFPGQGSHYAGMGHELYNTFPVIREWMDRAAEVADFDLLHLLFHDKEEDLQKTRWQQPALFTLEYAMVRYLTSLGIQPTAMAGHSLGELTALCLAGVYSFEDGFRIVNKRALCMDKACDMHADPGVMMAVDAPLDHIEDTIRNLEKVYVTNINSPHQVVLGGDSKVVEALGEDLKKSGFRSTMLRVSMAFHSPIMECIHDELRDFIDDVEFKAPEIPVISNTTKLPFSSEPDEIKNTVMAHLESPVHWMQNVRTLWNVHGVRLFVEVGPRDILSNLIGDCLNDSDCIQTLLPSAEALIYRTALGQLYAKGHLKPGNEARFVPFPGTVEEAETAKLSAPAAASPSSYMTPAPPAQGLEQIVQRTINSFVLESFGRFLRPNLLESIRREYDPGFSDENLGDLLARMLPGAAVQPAQPAAQVLLTPAAPGRPTPDTLTGIPALPVESGEPLVKDTTEEVILIIMEATGYDRDEIEPAMDLREDLSIRSSRLPVIMDAMEDKFRIKIDLEDFMDARTIQDIADRVSELTAGREPETAPQTSKAPVPPPEGAEKPAAAEQQESIKRVVFTEEPLETGDAAPLEVDSMESVAVFSAVGGTGLRKEVAGLLRRDHGVTTVPVSFMKDPSNTEEKGFDLLTSDPDPIPEEWLDQVKSLSGMVIIIDDLLEESLGGIEDVPRVLGGFFLLLKTFVESPKKKFVLLINKSQNEHGAGLLLSEGLLGMFLSAAQEFSSVQFRTVKIEGQTDLSSAIRGALDRNRTVIETIVRKGEVFTRVGRVVPLTFEDAHGIRLGAGDVVVLSGGGYGITARLARTLAPYGCKIAILGRTEFDPKGEISNLSKAEEIARTLEDLQSHGLECSYFSCDVTDPESVKSVMDRIVDRYGKIDGIIHGAGMLKDGFIKQMSLADFSAVVGVKFLGAWNLFQAVESAGLKFFTCLSSAAAIQGNPGQANYAAGNRMMSALAAVVRAKNDSILFKALTLPPIEGTGMADDPEIRSLMKRMNASYVHVDELGELFCRELFLGPPDEPTVMFMRTLPDLTTMRLDQSDYVPAPGEVAAGTISFPRSEFPLIDSVSHIDLKTGELEASRSFSQDRDLWVWDHKPFKFLKHPLVSANMALEAFMEASRLLYPHLTVRGIRDARFVDIIECPPGMERVSEISCRRISAGETEVACQVGLSTWEISPSGRKMERKSSNYEAVVILGHGHPQISEDLPGFPVRPEEMETRLINQEEVIDWYRGRTGLQGRYRLMDDFDGTGHGGIRGRFTYRESEDFSDPLKTRYQYTPYLLEAILQTVCFYVIMVDTDEPRSTIPYGVGEMLFTRKCRPGEQIAIEARMKDQDEENIRWDARAVDDSGKVIMTVHDLVMRWFSA